MDKKMGDWEHCLNNIGISIVHDRDSKVSLLLEQLCRDSALLEHSVGDLYSLLLDLPDNEKKWQMIHNLLSDAETNHLQLKIENPDNIPLIRDTQWYLDQFDLCRSASSYAGRQLIPELNETALYKAYDSATTFSENMDVADWFLSYRIPEEALLWYAVAEIKFRDAMTEADEDRWVYACKKLDKEWSELPEDIKIKLNAGGAK